MLKALKKVRLGRVLKISVIAIIVVEVFCALYVELVFFGVIKIQKKDRSMLLYEAQTIISTIEDGQFYEKVEIDYFGIVREKEAQVTADKNYCVYRGDLYEKNTDNIYRRVEIKQKMTVEEARKIADSIEKDGYYTQTSILQNGKTISVQVMMSQNKNYCIYKRSLYENNRGTYVIAVEWYDCKEPKIPYKYCYAFDDFTLAYSEIDKTITLWKNGKKNIILEDVTNAKLYPESKKILLDSNKLYQMGKNFDDDAKEIGSINAEYDIMIVENGFVYYVPKTDVTYYETVDKQEFFYEKYEIVDNDMISFGNYSFKLQNEMETIVEN